MWAGHGPIDLRRALAVSCNPYFQWVGRAARLREDPALRAPARPRRAVGHQPDRRDERAASPPRCAEDGARCCRATPRASRPPRSSSPCSSRPRSTAASCCSRRSAARRASCRSERWRLPEGTRFDGLADGFLARGQRGQREPGVRPGRRDRRQDGHVLGSRLVRFVRAGRAPAGRRRRLPAARQRPQRLGRGRDDVPRAVRGRRTVCRRVGERRRALTAGRGRRPARSGRARKGGASRRAPSLPPAVLAGVPSARSSPRSRSTASCVVSPAGPRPRAPRCGSRAGRSRRGGGPRGSRSDVASRPVPRNAPST